MDREPYSLLFILIWAAIVHLIALRHGFFKKQSNKQGTIPGKAVFGGFSIYFLISFLIAPLIIVAYRWIKNPNHKISLALSTQELGWFQLAIILAIFAALLLFLKNLIPGIQNVIWGGDAIWTRKHLRAFSTGIIAVFIAYPTVILVTYILDWIIQIVWGKSTIEQAAVEQLKGMLAYKPLFILTAVTVIFIVPIIEELLFRGFLQTWLKKYLSWYGALILTAAIFALFHFATSQGVKNLEVILALFVLSLYIGWVYEKESSLVASIGLHMTFNAINVVALFFNK